jgi:hypothetical protein
VQTALNSFYPALVLPKFFYRMRPIFLILLLFGVGIIAWLILSRPGDKQPETKQAAIAVSKYSEGFNNAVAGALTDYYKIAESFVTWDSAAAANHATRLTEDLNNLPLDELKKDPGIYETALMFVENTKGEAQTIASEQAIRAQRESFNSLTDNFYQFLNVVKYDRQVLYLQECPMAFDDTKSAQWLSQQEEIRNPYLGLYHPTYGKGMLKCGETKTTLNHTGAQ